MHLSEAWRISRVPYRELAYRPVSRAGYSVKGKDATEDVRIANRILFAASVNKVFFAVFTMGGSAFPFLLYRLGFKSISIASAVSLSMVLYLGYLVLYLIQILPSFVSAGSFAPLTSLPMSKREVSIVGLFSYLRTVDFLLVLGISTQVVLVGYFTGSALSSLLMLTAALINSVFGTAISLWLTGIFERTINRGGRSRGAGIIRIFLVVSWGLGVMSVVFLFNLASVLTPYLDEMLSSTARPTIVILTMMLHPFPFSLLVARSAGIQIRPIILLGSLMSIVCYSGLVILAARWSFGRINSIGSIDGLSSQFVGPSSADLRIIPRRPLLACIIKDLRVASRNPATGFLFALPIFETLAVILPLTSSQLVRTSVILVASAVAGGFALFVAFLLSNTEIVRMEYNDVLPMRAITPIMAKTLSSTISYLPAPIFLVLVAYGKTTDQAGLLVPVLMIMAVCAACLGEVTVLRKLGRNGSASLLNFGGGIAVGTVILLAPVLVYTIVFLGTRNHLDSILTCALVAAAELLATLILVRRSP